MYRNINFFIFLIIAFTIDSKAQDESSFDDQLRNFLQKDFFSLNVLIQSGFRYSFQNDDFQGGRSFEISKARIRLRGELDGGFFYRILFDAASHPNIRDAFAGYKLNDALSIYLGAMKPHQSLDYMSDPAFSRFIDRAQITRLLVASREVGLSARGTLGKFNYSIGLFNGNQLNDNNNNKFYGIGRFQYTIENLLPGQIQIAVSGSSGDSQGARSGSRGPYLRGRRTIFGTDIKIDANKFLLLAEFQRGVMETVELFDVNEIISGYYIITGYYLKQNIMILGRWQSWRELHSLLQDNQCTLGTNFYITDLFSIQLNIDSYLGNNANEKYGASMRSQIRF